MYLLRSRVTSPTLLALGLALAIAGLVHAHTDAYQPTVIASARRVVVSSSALTVLESIGFPHDGVALNDTYVSPTLRAVAETLEGNPSLTRISIVGHRDANESEGIALARAQQVRDYLVACGISPARLIGVAGDVAGRNVEFQITDRS